MGFLERVKKLFSRKKSASEEAVTEQPSEVKEPQQEIVQETVKEEAKAPREPERKQKTCPNCRAPNDVFVHKCWLCKNDI